MSHTPSDWLAIIRQIVPEVHEPLSDPLEGLTHELKEFWLDKYLNAHLYGYYDHHSAFEYADLQINLYFPNLFETWVSCVFLFLKNSPKVQKTKKTHNLFLGFHHITLTLPPTLTHDEGKKYLTEFIQEYFLGQIIKKPNGKEKKPKNRIETQYCFEIGESNNLHAHLFCYHPQYKLSTHNAPLKAYKYNARVEFCNDLNYALNSFNYITSSDKKGTKEFIFPNPKLLEIIKKEFSK